MEEAEARRSTFVGANVLLIEEQLSNCPATHYADGTGETRK